MTMYDIIRKKRDGGVLTAKEIAFFVDGYTKGDIPDYQASALCMAVFFRGMTPEETATLTLKMAESGDAVDLSLFGDLSADKHSTGGVGDKTSLIVAPLAAAMGGKIAKMSGRGLGHTGGTVDKLESIKGYQTTLTPQAFIEQVERVGIAVIGQSGNLAPADKLLYALRDVTATVDSLPLITSSIMSKKLAAGAHNIVLDVKVGSGAFMKTPADAKALAKAMVDIGCRCGRRVTALLTSMDAPLGQAVGNALEVAEAVEVLKGKRGDLREVCLALASEMAAQFLQLPIEQAKVLAVETLDSGKALQKMREWITAQGGDAAFIDNPALLPQAPYRKDVLCPVDGFIAAMNAEEIGMVGVMLGAGRKTKADTIDYAAGMLLRKKTGDAVKAGDVLCTLFAEKEGLLQAASERYLQAVTVADVPPQQTPLIIDVIRGA